MYDFCVNLYNKLKAAGSESTLLVAEKFYESRLSRKTFRGWEMFLRLKKREHHKQKMVIKYFEGNVMSMCFDRWKVWIDSLRREKKKNLLVVKYYHRQNIKRVFKDWAMYLKNERKFRRAACYWGESTLLKALSQWKSFCAELNREKQGVLQAMKLNRLRTMTVYFLQLKAIGKYF